MQSPRSSTTVYRNQNTSPEIVTYNYEPPQSIHQSTFQNQSNNQPSSQQSELSQNFSPSFANPMNSVNKTNTKTVNLDNGDRYEGEIKNGIFEGYGKYYYLRNKHEYHGEFKNGKPDGMGKLYKNIQQGGLFLVYEGHWSNGMKNGHGIYYYNDKDHFYEGLWLNDQRHGQQGTYFSPVGKYTGSWKQGHMVGRGEFSAKNTGTKYAGNFHNNEFIDGTISYSNKDEYIGAIKNGARNDPQGRYLFNNVSGQQIKYVGGWKNDQKHDEMGMATLTYANNDAIKGAYRNGKFVENGECIYQWGDGSVFKGWIQGGMLKGFVKNANGQEYEV